MDNANEGGIISFPFMGPPSMFNKFSVLLGSAICAISLNTSASIISGVHTLSDGREVALQGLEWLSLEHTANMSRNEVEGGFTDQYGMVWADDDWRYASRTETETLLGSLWDNVYNGWSNGNYIGSKWFIDNFQGLGFDPV